MTPNTLSEELLAEIERLTNESGQNWRSGEEVRQIIACLRTAESRATQAEAALRRIAREEAREMGQRKDPVDMLFFEEDPEEAGVHFDDFVAALGVWAVMRPEGSPTVADAAAAFGVTLPVIQKAVSEHYWLFLRGDDHDPAAVIEADGE